MTAFSIPREVLDRSGHIWEYHLGSKQTYASVSSDRVLTEASLPPELYAIFELQPKVPLPRKLLSASLATISLLNQGLESVPDSQLRPPQNLRTMASWLYLAAGQLRQVNLGGKCHWVRTSPSHNATHPCEIYLAAFGIEGLEPGLYNYCPSEFCLRRLRPGWDTLAQLKLGRPDLEYLRTVPAAILVSSIFSRSTPKFRTRAYRAAVVDTGRLTQNLTVAATGLGIHTVVRLRMNDETTRALIGVPEDASFAEAEAVQSMVVWADKAQRPLAAPPGANGTPMEPMFPIARWTQTPEMVGYGSIVAAHEDCSAPCVAARDVRAPLTELSAVSKNFPVQDLPIPDEPTGGEFLGKTLLAEQPVVDFAQHSIPRDQFWNLNRVAFRTGSHFPLFPNGRHAALVRPFWIVNGITGMEDGVWFYNPLTDRWSLTRRGHFRLEAQYLMLEDARSGNASALCIMTANLVKLLTEGGPDLYRLAHLEAGMVAQRLHLAARATSLGSHGLPGFFDDEIRLFLGLTRTGWEPIYAVALGIPASPAIAPPAEEVDPAAASLWRD